mgnify:CR=1 FL=1
MRSAIHSETSPQRRWELPEVWLRFILALFGLALAFAAALFSTVSRESGSVWTTVILAGTALVLATLVGLGTVPYLARRVMVERIRDAIDYDVTRAGVAYIVITLVIGIAALNTGNNLLYIIVAAMIFALLVQRLHPERDLSRTPLFQTMFVFQPSQLLNSFAMGDAGATSIFSGRGRAMILVVASITNVQSLPGPSLIARLSAATAFTAPTAVIVFAFRTVPPCTADVGGAAIVS